jgi:hypothetical protein
LKVDMTQQLVIADHSRRSLGRIAVVIGAIIAGFGAAGAMCGVGYASLVVVDPKAPVSAAVPALGCGLCLLPGLVVLAFGVRKVRLSRQLGVPTLTLPRAEPLCLGGPVTAWFCRSGGTAPVVGTPALSAELVCQEQVTYRQSTYRWGTDGTYRQGTDDHTVSHEVYRRPLPVTAGQVAGQVSGHMSVEVPVDRPPSVKLYHNKVIWTVRVQVRVPGVPDDEGTFEVTVLPVVAARLLGDAGRIPGAAR